MTKIMSVKLNEDLFLDIKKISELSNISCSEFIRNAIKKEIEIKKNDFIFRMSNMPSCDEEEEKEITNLLNNLTDDDLKIVKREVIHL